MKKKFLSGVFTTVFLLASVTVFFSACTNDPVVKPTPKVTAVRIIYDDADVTGSEVYVTKGEEPAKFFVEVDVQNNADKDVTWSVKGGSSTIDDGVLTIAEDDDNTVVLEVTATSNFDPSKFASVTVKIIADPEVLSVTVTAAADKVKAEETLQFTATVEVKNGARTDVNWSITSTGHAFGTTINSSGVLNIAKAETQDKITVKAVSRQPGFTDVSGSLEVGIEVLPFGTISISSTPEEGGIIGIFVGEYEGVTANTTAQVGETVTVTAVSNPGYIFDKWIFSANITAPDGIPSCTFTMQEEPYTFEAVFIKLSVAQIIDDFDYGESFVANNGEELIGTSATDLGYTCVYNDWGGLSENTPNNPDPPEGAGGQRLSAWAGSISLDDYGETSIERDLTVTSATVNITANKGKFISFNIYTRSRLDETATPQPFSIELHVGVAKTVYKAEIPGPDRIFLASDGRFDSGWFPKKYDLSIFKNDLDEPITNLAEIIITGWKITLKEESTHFWVSDISMVD